MRTNIGCVAVLLGMMGAAAEAAAVSEPTGVNAKLGHFATLRPLVPLRYLP